MINLLLVSSLPYNDFHESSEGLGIFMQLPVQPCEEHAFELVKQLK